MSTRGDARLIGLSGPDGSGKSTAAHALLTTFAEDGSVPAGVYLYGCFLCRPAPLAQLGHAVAAPGGRDGAHRSDARSRGSRGLRDALGHLHGLVDAAELHVRLRLATSRSRVVVTDRSPLDGLVKHDPRVESAAGRWYLRLARRYETIVWLDAPADVLARRDADHDAAELERMRETFAVWADRLENVTRIDAGSASAAVVARRVRELVQAPGGSGGAGAAGGGLTLS